jgi:hypothetical protein
VDLGLLLFLGKDASGGVVMLDALNSHAFRGILGMLVGCGLVLWPPLINFFAAALVVAASVREFRESFNVLDGKDAATAKAQA